MNSLEKSLAEIKIKFFTFFSKKVKKINKGTMGDLSQLLAYLFSEKVKNLNICIMFPKKAESFNYVK